MKASVQYNVVVSYAQPLTTPPHPSILAVFLGCQQLQRQQPINARFGFRPGKGLGMGGRGGGGGVCPVGKV